MIDWTESEHCRLRLHCDYCPYALERPAVEEGKEIEGPLGPGDTIPEWMVLPLHTEDHAGIEDLYKPPSDGKCPHRIEWSGGRAARVNVVLARVAEEKITEDDALDSLSRLGFDMEEEMPAP